MPRRELREPQWDVSVEGHRVCIEFVVPHSSFGAVDVLLDPEAAQELAERLIAVERDDRP
jgi:hypothetical protein